MSSLITDNMYPSGRGVQVIPGVTETMYGGYLYFGADPELFFKDSSTGKIIGSEKFDLSCPAWFAATKMHSDGVQLEFTFRPTYCRQQLSCALKTAIALAQERAAKINPSFTLSFDSVVEIDPDELASLSEKSRILGCAPSMNLYDSAAAVPGDASKSRLRSAGGHIHLGGSPILGLTLEKKLKLIASLDIFLGAVSVLIDRSDQALRRKVYGRAGEYRLPAHGIEYRTLSNFWIRSNILLSLVFGLARMAAAVVHADQEDDLLGRFNLEEVSRLINENDQKAAWKHLDILEEFISTKFSTTEPGGDGCFPLSKKTFPWFRFFLKEIEKKGLEAWFPGDVVTNWHLLSSMNPAGWEYFIGNRVFSRYRSKNAANANAKRSRSHQDRSQEG